METKTFNVLNSGAYEFSVGRTNVNLGRDQIFFQFRPLNLFLNFSSSDFGKQFRRRLFDFSAVNKFRHKFDLKNFWLQLKSVEKRSGCFKRFENCKNLEDLGMQM